MRKTDTEIKNALVKNKGNILLASRSLGCDRNVIYRRMKKIPSLQEARDDAEDIRIDLYEAAIDKAALEEGNVSAIKYILSTRGKRRGYSYGGERPTSTGITISLQTTKYEERDNNSDV